MSKQAPNKLIASAFLCLGMIIVSVQASFADTIHLKNGRTIQTTQARVKGDKLVFEQYGNEVEIPMALVDKVVKDEAGGKVTAPPPAPTPPPAVTATPAPGSEPGAAPQPEAKGQSAKRQGGPPPEQTREYWQDRVRAIYQEQDQLDEQLVQLRHEERAFLFSKRSTGPTRRKIEVVQARQKELEQKLVEIRKEARRQGIPPGWLRVPHQRR